MPFQKGPEPFWGKLLSTWHTLNFATDKELNITGWCVYLFHLSCREGAANFWGTTAPSSHRGRAGASCTPGDSRTFTKDFPWKMGRDTSPCLSSIPKLLGFWELLFLWERATGVKVSKLCLRRREDYLSSFNRTTSLWAKHLKNFISNCLCPNICSEP